MVTPDTTLLNHKWKVGGSLLCEYPGGDSYELIGSAVYPGLSSLTLIVEDMEMQCLSECSCSMLTSFHAVQCLDRHCSVLLSWQELRMA